MSFGGGGPSIPQRDTRTEFSDIFKNAWPQDKKAYGQWWNSEPLLKQGNEFALGNLQNVGQLIDPLKSLMAQVPGLFEQYQGQLSGLQKSLPGQFDKYQGQLAGLQRSLPGQFRGYQGQLTADRQRMAQLLAGLPNVETLTGPLSHLIGSQQQIYQGLLPTLTSQGALNNRQKGDVDQATRAAFAARGNVMGNQALGAELLNRDQYRQQRFANALNQGLGLSGSIGGLTNEIGGLRAQDITERQGLLSGMAGITGQQAGLSSGLAQLLAGLTAQRAGLTGQEAQLESSLTGQQAGLTGAQGGLLGALASGIQGLQGGALSQAQGQEQSQVGTFATLMNPLLSYASDLNSSNQNAAAAQNIAGANKSSGTLGSIASIIGPILGAVAMSDENLKTNIRPTKSVTLEGIPIKTFGYVGDKEKRRFKGVIAQDVEKVRPDAVFTMPVTGHKLVDVGALPGAPFEELKSYLPTRRKAA